MTEQTTDDNQDDNSKPEFNAGDRAKDFTSLHDEYHRVLVVSVNEDEETAEVIPMEGGNRGETVERDLEHLAEYEPTIWMAMLPHSWGIGHSKNKAIINATAHFNASDYEDEVTLWTAEVARDKWEIQPYGGVRSSKIENESESEVDPELLKRISDVRSDNEMLAESAAIGEQPTDEYLREVKKRR